MITILHTVQWDIPWSPTPCNISVISKPILTNYTSLKMGRNALYNAFNNAIHESLSSKGNLKISQKFHYEVRMMSISHAKQ